MYFSSSAMYTLPYYATKNAPCVLICLAVPGTNNLPDKGWNGFIKQY